MDKVAPQKLTQIEEICSLLLSMEVVGKKIPHPFQSSMKQVSASSEIVLSFIQQ